MFEDVIFLEMSETGSELVVSVSAKVYTRNRSKSEVLLISIVY